MRSIVTSMNFVIERWNISECVSSKVIAHLQSRSPSRHGKTISQIFPAANSHLHNLTAEIFSPIAQQ